MNTDADSKITGAATAHKRLMGGARSMKLYEDLSISALLLAAIASAARQYATATRFREGGKTAQFGGFAAPQSLSDLLQHEVDRPMASWRDNRRKWHRLAPASPCGSLRLCYCAVVPFNRLYTP